MSAVDIPQTDMLDVVTYKEISQKHPELQAWEGRLADYSLMYRGGEEFLLAAGQLGRTRANRVFGGALTDIRDNRRQRRRFLWQQDGEPDTSYISRWERAVYIGYIGAIMDYFRHWLFSTPPRIRCSSANEPAWWPGFRDDADGCGKDFLYLARDLFLDVLIGRRAGWLIGGPRADAASAADDRTLLTKYDAAQILDWQRDSLGNLEWVVLGKHETRRDFPGPRLEYQQFTYVDRERFRTWEVQKNQTEPELVMLDEDYHGLGEVPFVMMELPYGLWIANKLASWQLDLFNQMSMLSSSQLMACFLQPYFKGHTEEEAARVLGDSVMMFLRAGDGNRESEDFGWKAPEMGPLEHVANALKEKRDEGYRIVHQMALAVDSQAIGAIARSGASKIEDRKASEIILGAYGGYVREHLLKTLSILSLIYKDGEKWTVDGYDNFEVSDFTDEITSAGLVLSMMSQGGKAISPTAWGEIWKDVLGGRLLNHVDEDTRSKIRKEVDSAAEEQEAMPSMLEQQMGPPPQKGDAKASADTGGGFPKQPGVLPGKPAQYSDKPAKPA